MENFIYSIPTTIYFGKGQIEHVAQAVRPYGKKALIVYGGGSVKKNGIFDRVTEILEHEGIAWEELGGVEPNPRIETVRKGAELCKAGNIEVVLPIGGGSTIDCAKIIAAGALYDGDAWDLVLDGKKIQAALPIVAVLTLAATGSEMDTAAVISDMASNNKLGTKSEHIRPKAAIMDPSWNRISPMPRDICRTAWPRGSLRPVSSSGSGRWSIPMIMRPGPISCGLEAGPLTIF